MFANCLLIQGGNLKSLKLILLGTIFMVQSILLSGCDFGNGLSAISVDRIFKNPRIYEGKEISVVGVLMEPDDKFKVLNVGGRLEGSQPDQVIYLQNMMAKVDYRSKVIVKGAFSTISVPIIGSYLVIDAKSVEPCTKMSFC